MLQMIIVVGIVMVIPVAVFLGMISLAIGIWCWNRIGKYFINFGRWIGSWRNFVPLASFGVFSILVLVVLYRFVSPLAVFWLILLVLNLIVGVVCTIFAFILWTIRFCEWAWGPYRRSFWRSIGWVWELFGRERPAAAKRPGPRRPPVRPASGEPTSGTQPQKKSFAGSFMDLIMGRPPEPRRPLAAAEAGPQPRLQPSAKQAKKQSWLGSFWALLMGKPPQPRKQQTRPRVQTTEQVLGRSGGEAADVMAGPSTATPPVASVPRTGKKGRPKQSWFGSFWALLLGKPIDRSKTGAPNKAVKAGSEAGDVSEPAPKETKTKPKQSWFGSFWSLLLGKPANRNKTGAAKTAAKPGSEAGSISEAAGGTAVAGIAPPVQQGERGKSRKPAKRGFFGRVRSKMGEGIEWVRVRLNLD